MSEHQRRARLDSKDGMAELSQRLTDHGKIIEAGWIGLRIACIDASAPEIQVNEMRMASMAGARHLFSSVMTILDPGDEPTDADLKRMELISNELDEFGRSFELRFGKTSGSA